MKVTLDDIRTREQQHVLQTYKRQPVAFVRGQGSRLYDADGPRVPRPAVGDRRHVARPRAPGADRRHRRPGGDAAAHVEPLLPPVSGRGGGPAGAALRPAAHVLLQQRHRSQRGEPEVRAPLLAHAGREGRAWATWPWRTASPAAPWARCRSRTTRTIASRSCRSSDRSRSSTRRSPKRCWRPSTTRPRPSSPSRSAVRAACATCRRGSCRRWRTCTAKTGTLLIADEVQSGLGRTGYGFYFQALGWKPDLVSVGKALGSGVPVARGADIGKGRRRDLRRRSRHHLRRQPAVVPRGGCSSSSS